MDKYGKINLLFQFLSLVIILVTSLICIFLVLENFNSLLSSDSKLLWVVFLQATLTVLTNFFLSISDLSHQVKNTGLSEPLPYKEWILPYIELELSVLTWMGTLVVRDQTKATWLYLFIVLIVFLSAGETCIKISDHFRKKKEQKKREQGNDLEAPSRERATERAVGAGLFRKGMKNQDSDLHEPLLVNHSKPSVRTNFEENVWAVLKSAIGAIYLKQQPDLEEICQAVSGFCIHKMGGTLYQLIERECEQHISAALRSLIGQSEDLVVFLSLVRNTWQDFCEQMSMICRIPCLHCTSVEQIPNEPSLQDMCLKLFRKHLSSEVENKTVSGLLKMIERERSGEAVDRTLLNHLLKMFTVLGIYSESFEKPFLECTSEFYAAEGVKYMQQLDVPDYLKHVEVRLHEEHDRCVLYLDARTREPLVVTAERQLLLRHIAAILDKGFMRLMDGNRIQDLKRTYMLFSRVDAHESLRLALGSYIQRTGQGIVMDEEKDKDMVSSLSEFKAALDTIWKDSFSKNDAFCNTIKDAFEHLISLRQNRPAELIAKFLDEKLRAGNKGASEEEVQGTLDKVLVLLRFIQAKDVFEALYKKDLAKRLLLGKSASIDAEKSMISKLKTECGSQLMNKLEGMCKDIELSKEIYESFKQSSHARTKLPSGIKMSFRVLTTRYWPTYPQMDIHLPHELNVYQDIFKEFYSSKYSRRQLMWQNSLSQCVLKAEFSKGETELAVSLFQTVVLVLFNDAQKLSFQDIRDATSIEDKELRRTLQSLACGKFRVLQKIPKGREVDDDDSFMVNDKFHAPRFRIKVNAIRLKETVEENTSTAERVFQDLRYQVDVAIIRIMKTRKVLSHTLLVIELSRQLKFPIKPADLKKHMESLIHRGFLERDKNNPQIYNFLPGERQEQSSDI